MKKIMIGIIIVIVLIIGTIFFIRKININKIDHTELMNTNNKIKTSSVTDANTFYTVQSCISQYLSYVVSKNTKSVLNLLDEDYKTMFSVTEENVLEKVEQLEGNQSFVAKQMIQKEISENVTSYYVKGYIQQDTIDGNSEKEVFYSTVKLDTLNHTFSIMPFGYIETEELNETIEFNGGKLAIQKYDLFYNQTKIYVKVENNSSQKINITNLELDYCENQNATEKLENISVEPGQQAVEMIFNNEKGRPEQLRFLIQNQSIAIDLNKN